MAGSAGAGKLFGSGGVAEQFLLWGVVAQVAGALLQPIMVAISQQIFELDGMQVVALSPAQLADLVLKGWYDEASAAQEAKKAGISPDRFHQMIDDAGEPPGLQMLLEGFRRGFIGWDTDNAAGTSVVQGIKQSRLRDQWASLVQDLVTQVIPVGDAVSATVRGQISHALGAQIAFYSGISADDFQILVNTAGNPPGPGELITLARRGLIPVGGVGPQELSLQQGIYEGDTKDKWFPMYVQLMEYLPPPRTITALERAGAITPAMASALYQKSGLSAALAAAYSADASAVKLAKTKELAEGTVLDLYKGKVITETEAAQLLATLGYTQQESGWILAWTDLRREISTLEKAITKVSTAYVARKIGAVTAAAELGKLGVPADQQTVLLEDWTLERDASVKVLTAAEIGDALFYQVIDQPTAQAALESLGYDPYDAWVVLSLRMHGAQGTAPPVGENVTGQIA